VCNLAIAQAEFLIRKLGVVLVVNEYYIAFELALKNCQFCY
jgi:hypothetical protein